MVGFVILVIGKKIAGENKDKIVSATILAFDKYGTADIKYITLPLVIVAFGMFSSLLGLLSNLVFKAEPATMLRNAPYVAIAALLVSSYAYLHYMNF